MSMLSESQIRSRFLAYFQRVGHTVVPSSPLVPSDPTLLFTNAGMVQFKDVFTGKQTLAFRRATTAQKCVRAGGKHNDLDNVGRTARHHTFFEMLGNFSFGDYFKEDAITFAWELLHKEFGLSKDRLWFTVFCGEDGIPADEEARRLWTRIAGVGEDRVLGLGKKENFWMMGDTGPQGPCSEIHFYQGGHLPCAEEKAGKSCLGPACDCDRFLEIWNLVFMQFERREKGGPLLPLPAPSIDTGAGLERLSSVLQGKMSNYDTDLFMPLLMRVADAAKRAYRHSDSEDDIAMRVLADHARASAFLIADGVMPSNLGRGYVLRSMMRRAIRHAVHLKLEEGFFGRLCLDVTAESAMGAVYPELVLARSLIEKTVYAEDQGFRKTLGKGLRLIAENKSFRQEGEQRVMSGSLAFQLHDTYGFPLDLTQVIGREQGFVVDEAGFAEEMERQRSRSKFTGSGDHVTSDVYMQVLRDVGATTFTGYVEHETKASVLALIQQGKRMQEVGALEEVEVVFDQTPLYGRAGGQVGDTGQIVGSRGSAEVIDTWKPLPDLWVQKCTVTHGQLQVGDMVGVRIDVERRAAIRRNHSATHLLHDALRKVLGAHVTQKGSYVGPDKLTFDFSHFEPLTIEQRYEVEAIVHAAIFANIEQSCIETDVSHARELGAIGLFGEKYGDVVRVVRFGDSVEFCGGTHVGRTGDIGLFQWVSETSVAKGIRRIEALTGMVARKWLGSFEESIAQLQTLLRVDHAEVVSRVERLVEDLKRKDKELAQWKQKCLEQGGSLFEKEQLVSDVKVLVVQVEESDAKALREAAESFRQKRKVDVCVVASAAEERVTLVVSIENSLSSKGRLHAGRLAGELGQRLGGKGGGRADLAQAGGSSSPDRLHETLEQTFVFVAQELDATSSSS